jgi:hypothetical protein
MRRRRSALALAALALLAASACLGARALQFAPPAPPASIAAATTPAIAPAPADTARLDEEVGPSDAAPASHDADALAYAGHDAHHRPRYVQRRFTDEERQLLRDAFGIADPNRLWLPDSSTTAVLRYDAATGLVARVGYGSMRRPGETWEQFGERIRRLDRRAWPRSARESYFTGLRVLDPSVRREFEALLAAARAAGFRVRVAESYRRADQQAFLLAHGNGKTFTATSAHQYGRAVDIIVGDGRITRPRTAREWIAFRRWVLAWGEGRFRLVGAPAGTWDWPHVELVDPPIGFRTVDALIAAARACLAAPRPEAASDPCALPRDGEANPGVSAGR